MSLDVPVSAPARVLVIERDPRTAMLLGEMLRAGWTEGLLIAHAQRFADATQELIDHGATCVLLDLAESEPEPLTALQHVLAAAPDVPVIVLSDRADDDLGVSAIKAGAQDFLRNSELNPGLLGRSVRYAIERKRSEVELAHQALHDPLTGLPNRALFLDRLTVALDRSRRTGAPVAVLFLDVDGFKQINDSLGHAAGDALLTVLADRFNAMLRPMDTVARFGGDEFTFLFEELESERESVLIADRISRSAAAPMTLGDGEMTVAASIGIAIVTDPSVAPDAVIREADAAMYRAKEHGGARFELYDEASRHRAAERLELEGALRQAVERDELRVHYQPEITLRDDTELSGFEALIRWEHPTRGLIEADQFLALAEATGLIVPIGHWVLAQALRECSRWREQRPGVTVSVNLSARQLADPGLVASLAATLRESGADPGVLRLEVTENTVQRDLEKASEILGGLHRLGVSLVVDDFGTGNSSLQSLRTLPLQEIKIDPSFVANLGNSPGDAALMGALVDLGHALGVSVIAEGVETDTQLAHLRDLGCDGAQGYLFSRPVPEEGVHALLAASTQAA